MDKECIISPSFPIPLNGSLVGYFKGGEGDPLTPFLFVPGMEFFLKNLAL